MRKILVLLILVVVFIGNTHIAIASTGTPPQVTADGALLVDTSSGKILYEKNKDTKFYPASTTKIMTALLVLENCKLDDIVTIGKKPSSFVDGNKIYLFEDEQLTVDQLMHALLIASANDVAIALAEHVAGSEEAFADMMNKRAKELGCTNTHFVNSHGLDDPEHYTTANDLYLIAKEAMKYDAFRDIIKTISFTMEPTNKQPLPRPLYTNNQLFISKKYKVEGANGMKVGYTTIAGHSFVGSAYRGDTKLIVVLLHDKKPGLWEDASSLLNYGFDNYKTEKEISSGEIISSINVSGTLTTLPLISKDDLYYTHLSDSTPDISTDIVITDDCRGSISKGQNMGYAVYKDNGAEIGRVSLIAANDLIPALLYNYTGFDGSYIKKSIKPAVYIPAITLSLLFLAAVIRILQVKIRRAAMKRKRYAKSAKLANRPNMRHR